MPTYEADRLRLEIVIEGETRVVELIARGKEKVRMFFDEVNLSAADPSDGVERVSVNLSAMGPVSPGDQRTGVTPVGAE